jgi:hypothetical protein
VTLSTATSQRQSVLELPEAAEVTVVIDSLSKRFSACGARIGCLLSKRADILDAATRFAMSRLSPPTLGQLGGMAAIEDPGPFVEGMISRVSSSPRCPGRGAGQAAGRAGPRRAGRVLPDDAAAGRLGGALLLVAARRLFSQRRDGDAGARSRLLPAPPALARARCASRTYSAEAPLRRAVDLLGRALHCLSRPNCEASKLMTEAVQSLQALLGRLSSFFDIFDLSFIVSGGEQLWRRCCSSTSCTCPTAFPDWMQGACMAESVLVLACYVLGMLSFVLGRLLRRLLRFFADLASRSPSAARPADFADALQQHELQRQSRAITARSPATSAALAPLQDPKSRRGKPDPVAQSAALRLYALMWTQVRQQSSLAPSQVLLNRYWVMAALCDGMVVAAALWLGVLLVPRCTDSRQCSFCFWVGLGWCSRDAGDAAVSARSRALCPSPGR